jgi:hypothetical protein
LKSLLLALILCLGLPQLALAAVRYVDASASGCSTPTDTDYDPDANSGAGGCGSGTFTVYNTVVGGVAVTQAGDTLYIRGGTYAESISANSTKMFCGTSWDNKVLYSSAPGETAILTGVIDVTNVVVSGGCGEKQYIEFYGLRLATNFHISKISITNTVHHIRFNGMYIANSMDNGCIQFGASTHHGEVINSTITHCGWGPNRQSGTTSYPLYISGNDHLLEHNDVSDSPFHCFHIYHTTIMPLRVITRYNRVYACGQEVVSSGAILTKGTGNQTYGNEVWGGSTTNSHGIVVYSGDAQLVANNTVHSLSAPGSNLYGIFISSSGAGNATNTRVINNIVYQTAGILNDGTGTILTTNRTTDPSFTNSASRDYTLLSTSAAINAGTPVTTPIIIPYNGAAPDQGAHETFTISPPAQIATVFVDVTLGMSINTPVIVPSTTGWSVNCTGSNCGTPVVAAAAKLISSDSIVRLTLTGLGGAGVCEVGQTWTVSYNGSTGSATDSSLIGNAENQKLFTFTTQTTTNNCGGGGTPPPSGGLEVSLQFEDGSGTNANDSTANNRDGTLTGGTLPTWGEGKNATGGIVLNDLINNYVAVPYGNGLNPSTTDYSICIGVKPNSGLEAGTRTYFGSQLVAGQLFYMSWYNGTWSYGINSTVIATNSEFPVVAGWSRICLILDSGTATLWVNGVKGTGAVSVKSYGSFTFASDFRLGLPSGFGTSVAPGGTVDNLKIYSAALTDQEVADDYADWEPASPPASGTFNIAAIQFKYPRRKADLSAQNYGSANATVAVREGGYVAVDIQLDCAAGTDCGAVGRRLMYQYNGGAVTAVPDTFTVGDVRFINSTESSLVIDTTDYLLTGALTKIDGSTQTSAAAVPVTDFANGTSQVLRFIVQFDRDASGQYCFLLYDQDGNVFNGTYTPSSGACVNITEMSGSGT